MAEEIRIEHALAWRDRLLLERLVRVLEKWQGVDPALHAEIEKAAQAAEALKDAQGRSGTS